MPRCCWLCRPRHQCAGDEGASQRSYRISLRSASHTWRAIEVREHPPGSARRTTPYTGCANVPLSLRMDACPDRLSRVLIEQQQDRTSAPRRSSRPNVADQPVQRGGSRPKPAVHGALPGWFSLSDRTNRVRRSKLTPLTTSVSRISVIHSPLRSSFSPKNSKYCFASCSASGTSL